VVTNPTTTIGRLHARIALREIWRTPGVVLSFLVPFLAASLGSILGIARFWVNDDVGHLLLISGGFTGTPESLNPVLGPIFTAFVSWLYRVTGRVPWYPLTILVIPAISGSLLLVDLCRRVSRFFHIAIAVLVSFGLLLLGVQLNFTFASFIACSSAMLLLLLRIMRHEVRIGNLLAPFVLCVLSLSLRTNWSTSGVATPPAFLYAGILVLVATYFLGGTGRFGRTIKLFFLFSLVYLASWLPQLVILSSDHLWAEFIDFYRARGSLNGVSVVYEYVNSTTPSEIFAKTGMDYAAMWELQNWSLFDSRSVPVGDLLALATEARASRNPLTIPAIQTGLRNQLGTFLTGMVWFILALILCCFVSERVVRRKNVLSQFGLMSVLLVLSLTQIHVVTFGTRFPTPVRAGTLFATALVLMVTMSLGSISKPDVNFWRKIINALAFLLLLVGCWLNFGRDVRGVSADNLSKSKENRRFIRETTSLDKPVLFSAGNAYILFPFDNSVPAEYLSSKAFHGGSYVRSPQHLRRWNTITGESQTTETLFGPKFYSRVYFHAATYEEVTLRRTPCMQLRETTKGVFDGVRCSYIAALEAGNRWGTHWFSKPEGFLFRVNLKIDDLSLNLISPFGKYAKNHLTEISVEQADGTSKKRLFVVVPPGSDGYTVSLHSLEAGDQISIRSVNRCVVPFEIDPELMPDRTELCVGLSRVAVNGETISLSRL